MRASYARWRAKVLGQITDRIEEQLLVGQLGEVANMALLDVGCGDGALAVRLTQQGARVTGIDPDLQMLAGAETRAAAAAVRLQLVAGGAEQLPFPDNTFDRIVAVTVLCLLPSAEHAVTEMARVLKPEGQLVVGELGRWNLWAATRRVRGWLGSPTWRIATFFTSADLRRMLETSGLVVSEARGAVYYPPWGFAARLLHGIDPYLGGKTLCGAAFIAVSATKPVSVSKVES